MLTVRQLSDVARRSLSTLAFVFVFAVSASAYTVVMRDGRRLEIPAHFVVTQSTLTYEVQSGIQITLQLSTIDVPATEKANNEKPGALLERVAREAPMSVDGPSNSKASTARRTITNRDLEAAARRRVASEQAYERRAKELGLPSLAEARRLSEEATAVAQSDARERLAAERESEGYWRSRAAELRTEMSVLDAEIRYVRSRLDEVPSQGWGGSVTTVTGIVPFISFGNVGRGRHSPRRHQQLPSVYSARGGQGAQHSGRIGVGLVRTQPPVFVNPAPLGQVHIGGRPRAGVLPGANLPLGGRVGVIPNATLFSLSPAYDYSYERSELITRFNDLAAARAGLNARWRELEEEARRAGVPPGWLRR